MFAASSWALLKVGLLLSALLVGLAIVNRKLRDKDSATGGAQVRLSRSTQCTSWRSRAGAS